MRWRKGSRPLTVTLFATAFLAAALIRLVEGLTQLPSAGWRFADLLGSAVQSQDVVIVALSAEFTIALIPIVWIYGFANRFARWLVLGFALLKLYGFKAIWMITSTIGVMNLWTYVEPLLIGLAVLCLLMPATGAWLLKEKEVDRETFV